jgi:hypothetical protein
MPNILSSIFRNFHTERQSRALGSGGVVLWKVKTGETIPTAGTRLTKLLDNLTVNLSIALD